MTKLWKWLVPVTSCSFAFIALFLIIGARDATNSPLDSVYELRATSDQSSLLRREEEFNLAGTAAPGFGAVRTHETLSQSDEPILIVTGSSNRFGGYYAEILRTEGLNLFGVVDVEDLTPERLASTDVVILTVSHLSSEKVHQFENWIRAGGNLIAIRPEGNLLPMLGVGTEGDPISNGYVLFDQGFEPARGIVHESLQLRVPASRFQLKESIAVAHLYETATRPLGGAAITVREIERGRAVAYAYDLAQSVVRTRQGNPAWINQERDGLPPRRANDLFFPDDIDMNKIGIPQADEQQRFFANLILTLNSARRPLPRLWYLPAGKRVAIILASDDHNAKRGTHQSFAKLNAESPLGCRNEQWECYRATSYVSPETSITPDQVKRYEALGFELGVHTDTECKDQDISTISLKLAEQVGDLGKQQLGIQKQQTHRFHCIPWNGWVDTAKVERDHGIRFSLNYYYWPGSWIQGRQGFMTGSGFPMRYADLDGQVLDIYQAATHIVDENGIEYSRSIGSMIDKALGPEQFFGIFGTHYDFRDDFLSTAIRIAKKRGVALITAAQALRWVDARSESRFEKVAWEHGKLAFDVYVEKAAEPMTVMIPFWSSKQKVISIECDGQTKAFHTIRVKGLEYASLPLRSGSCSVIYKGT